MSTTSVQAATVAIVTLGCGRNEVDSDQLSALLHRGGYRLVEEPHGADVVLVNTCTFIDAATEESVDTVLAACDLKDDGTRAVVVVGCMAERYGDELAGSILEADAVVGFGGYPRLPEVLDDLLAGRAVERSMGARTADRVTAPSPPAPSGGGLLMPSRRGYLPQDELDRLPASGPRFPLRGFGASAARPWAYLKIASGCDRSCAFCAIPSWRGAFRSRPLDEIVTEARWLVERGARELVLVSENTTSWGKDLPDLDGERGRALQPVLLEALSDIDGLDLVRLMYLQPAEIQPGLLEAMAELPRVASYFDLSLQHVSASVLERMRRRGSPEGFRDLIARIRALDPEAVFRSNFIVGFPGETDADVDELEDFLEDARLDWVGVFTYSPQDGTPAVGLPGQIPPDEALARQRRIVDVQERVADEAAAAFVGRHLDVTVQELEGDHAIARSYREAPDTDGEIRVEGVHAPIGARMTVEVEATVGVDLVARPLRA